MVTYVVWSFIYPGSASSRMRCWCIEMFWDTTAIVLGEKYGVEWGKGIPIPTTWRIWDADVDEPIMLFPFRELIGALLWIALLSRPDIVNAVRAVARYCSAPKMVHWKAALGILGYAVRTSSFGITFQRGTVEGFHLVSFAGADYASKATDRRSVSGGVVI